MMQSGIGTCAAWCAIVVAVASAGETSAEEKILLRNSMNSPITVLVQPEQRPSPTQLRILVDETQDYPLKWDGPYEIQIVPDDMPNAGYYLGRHDLRAIARAIGSQPMQLRGDFRLVYDPRRRVFSEERVAVFLDRPLDVPFRFLRTQSSRLTDYMQALTDGRGPNEPRPTATKGVLTVIVPPSAKVTLSGHVTTTTGTVRSFDPPGLKPGKSHLYKVKVEWTSRDGHKCKDERDVEVRAGEVSRQYFKLPFPEPPVEPAP